MIKEEYIKVSVIIPVFNGGQYICECLDSLIVQSLEMIEIICIDDGSTDDTELKLKSYLKKYENIKVITENSNRGQAYARNVGIRHASGEYIYFLDADDMLMKKDSLERLYECAKKSNAQIVIFDSEILYIEDSFEDDSLKILLGSNPRFTDKLKEGIYKGDSFFLNMMKNAQSSIAVWRQFYNLRFIIEKKLMFDDGTSPNEDMLFTFKAMVLAENVYYYPFLLHRYSLHHGSSSIGEINKNRILSYMHLIDSTVKFFIDRNISKESGNALLLYYERLRSYIGDGLINCIKSGVEIFDDDSGRWEFYRLLFLLGGYKFIRRPFSCKEYSDIISRQVVVYGNGKVSSEVCDILERFGITNYVIAVTDNEKEKYGIFNIKDFRNMAEDCFVIIASVEKNKAEMETLLKKYAFKHYTCLS